MSAWTKLLTLQLFKAGIVSKQQMLNILGVNMSSSKARTKEEAIEMAASENLVAFFPNDDELLLDLDEPFDVAVVKAMPRLKPSMDMATPKPVDILYRVGDVNFTSYFFTMSKSGNAHAYVRVNQHLTYEERMVIQIALGSDPVREMYNLLRHRDTVAKTGEEVYTMALFETKEQAKLVRRWRLQVKLDARREKLKDIRLESNIWGSPESRGF